VLLFSFEGLELLEERVANGPLTVAMGRIRLMAYCMDHRPSAIGYKLVGL
jgi:hypothetical protein